MTAVTSGAICFKHIVLLFEVIGIFNKISSWLWFWILTACCTNATICLSGKGSVSIWPWEETHFLRENVCRACHMQVNNFSIGHFHVTIMSRRKIRRPPLCKFFWCRCGYSVYDHYPPDECCS